MVLATLAETWCSTYSRLTAGKRHHGRRCSVPAPRRAADMHPWTGQDPPSLPPSPDPAEQHDLEDAVGGEADAPEGSLRCPAAAAAVGPGAGDFGGDVAQLVRTPPRFSRSSSMLEQVPEEIGVGDGYQDSEFMPPATCSVRRARRLTDYRHNHEHSHHHHHHHQHHQPPPQELPPGVSAMGSISGSSLGPPIVFNPPGVDWQRSQAAALRLAVEYPLPPNPGGVRSFAPNIPPRRCRPVAGDGNCLFRALSWWITGSEEQHLQVRQLIVDELRRDGGRQYDSVAQADYVDESRIDGEGVWGSDVEIFVAATMLRTPVAVYSAFGDRQYLWQVFQPLERAEGAAAGGAATHHDHLIYLQNSNSHFEPVVDI